MTSRTAADDDRRDRAATPTDAAKTSRAAIAPEDEPTALSSSRRADAGRRRTDEPTLVEDEPAVAAVEDEAVLAVADAGRAAGRAAGRRSARDRVESSARGDRGATYPLVMPSADEADGSARRWSSQLDDYLLPRLRRLDAPLLVVVGGSTGAGKSTLVNSLVRAPVSPAGRAAADDPGAGAGLPPEPTCRGSARASCCPGWPARRSPSYRPETAATGRRARARRRAWRSSTRRTSTRWSTATAQLAAQLLAAADLWLFVTTAARYADAVPWELLRTARLRGTVVALVLDRVPPRRPGRSSAHLREMLPRRLGAAPLFVLPETTLDGQGLLAESVIKPLRDWFGELAADVEPAPPWCGRPSRRDRRARSGGRGARRRGRRAGGRRQGAGRAGGPRLPRRASGPSRTACGTARLLRGEVLSRWQELVGTGEFLRALQARVGRCATGWWRRSPAARRPASKLQAALESSS